MQIDGDASAYCPAVIELDKRQLDFLAGLPRPAHRLESRLACELVVGHDGPHAALGQHSWETQWWVEWSLAASETSPKPDCKAERIPGDVEEDDNGCVLFGGHAGPHSHICGQFFT